MRTHLQPGPTSRWFKPPYRPREGICPQVVERIFDPYFTTKKEGEGTGLGLAMVHSIIQDMGGAIALETKLGEGTRFDAWFPAADADQLDDQTDDAAVMPLGDERVLVDDDDDEPAIAALIGNLLTSLGYTPTVVSLPHKVLELLAAHPETYQLIVSDVAMPGMTGVELARNLAARQIHIPIVLCSGYGGGINWCSASSVGIRGMVTKPIRKPKLAQTIREVLDQQCENGTIKVYPERV
ncbi:MAG: CheY-like chemotaxis protein [Candidatus Omnitrophota bacterium]|jgi:CheY-like chemotaxis protein